MDRVWASALPLLFFFWLKRTRISHSTWWNRPTFIFYVFTKLLMSDLSESAACSELETFLSPNSRKFAVECDLKIRISQSVRSLGFFLEKTGFFWKKLFFSKFGWGGKFALEHALKIFIPKYWISSTWTEVFRRKFSKTSKETCLN